MGATITHDEILARLACPWIEIVPNRRTMAKRNLPTHAHETSPNVIVLAHPNDKTSLDICSQFRQKHWNPRFNTAHVPSDFAWQILTPNEERLLLFTWVNWLRNSRQMFEEFCRETNHEFGTLTQDGMIVMASRSIPFRACRLTHEDQLRLAKKSQSKEPDVVALAKKYLRAKADGCQEIEMREFWDEAAAHDDELIEETYRQFLAKMKVYQARLAAEFGEPSEAGKDEHDAIPRNGILEHAIWDVNGKSLFLAVSHEDGELPCEILLGVSGVK